MIAEPATTLTDFLLAILAWWWAWSLRQRGLKVERSRRFWACGMALQGAGAFLGGIFHGFPTPLGPEAGSLLWLLTLVLLSVASAAFVVGLGVAVLPARAARILLVAMGVKVTVYAVWIWQQNDFFPALCDQALGLSLLVVLLLLGRKYLRSVIPNIALGLMAIVLGGLIQQFRFGLHEHFNHNDIYHLFGGLALWCFFRAGRHLYDHVA